MIRIIAAAVSLFAVTISATAGINFDQGVDVKAAVEQAEAAAPQLPEAKIGVPSYSFRDCKKVDFTVESPLTSPEISLRSMEMYEDCQSHGAPVGQICVPRPEYNVATTKVVITEPRVLQPGQKETFEVCLQGHFLSLRPVSTVYSYSVRQDFDGFKLTPGQIVQTKAAGNVCRLAMDNGYVCVYQCNDGSFISKPNPFPVIPSPNPWVGPIYTPCSPTTQDLPQITGK